MACSQRAKCMMRAASALLALTMAAASMAFVEKRPPGAKFTPEQSQEQVEQQQGYNGKYGVLGQEDLVQQKAGIKRAGVDSKAEDIVVVTSPAGARVANRALIQAEAEMALTPRPKTSIALWGIGFLVLGAVAVWAFKSYADKVVPEMPTTPKSKVKW